MHNNSNSIGFNIHFKDLIGTVPKVIASKIK